MTLSELTHIIKETIDTTEDDLHTYAELAQRYIAVTIQVMQLLQNLPLDLHTRDLKDALLVQEIVAKIRTHR